MGKDYNPIAASLSVVTTPVSTADFYTMVLKYEARLLSQQADNKEWTSSANATSQYGNPAVIRRRDYEPLPGQPDELEKQPRFFEEERRGPADLEARGPMLIGPIVSPPAAATSAVVVPPVGVRLRSE